MYFFLTLLWRKFGKCMEDELQNSSAVFFI